MKNFKTTAAPGLFDIEFRQQWLLAKGNSLSRLDAVIDSESFRPVLEAALDRPVKGPGGRPAHDRLKMFKALLVQRFYNLSDEQTEYQINDRLSFQQLRYIARRRNAAAIGFINWIYNLARYEQIVRLKLIPLQAI